MKLQIRNFLSSPPFIITSGFLLFFFGITSNFLTIERANTLVNEVNESIYLTNYISILATGRPLDSNEKSKMDLKSLFENQKLDSKAEILVIPDGEKASEINETLMRLKNLKSKDERFKKTVARISKYTKLSIPLTEDQRKILMKDPDNVPSFLLAIDPSSIKNVIPNEVKKVEKKDFLPDEKVWRFCIFYYLFLFFIILTHLWKSLLGTSDKSHIFSNNIKNVLFLTVSCFVCILNVTEISTTADLAGFGFLMAAAGEGIVSYMTFLDI